MVGVSTLQTVTLALSAAGTWLALGFTPEAGKTVSKIKANTSAVSGTLGNTDITCDIYSDSNGAPGSSLQSSSTVTGPPINGSAWWEWTGFTQALTAHTQYWAVFKNVNGTPASNFPTFRYGGAQTGPLPTDFAASSTATWGSTKKHSTDSGSTWAGTNIAGVFGLRIEYSDGSFQGWPASALAQNAIGVGIYSTREWGVKFTAPANAKLSVRGAQFALAKTASPTGDIVMKLYDGTTPLGTSLAIPKANLSTSLSFYHALFSAPITVAAGTVLRLTLAESTQSDANTNRYNGYTYTIENDANSKALMPMGGTWQQTYYDGSSWAETDTAIPICALLLDTDADFVSQGGFVPMLCE